MAEPRLCSSCAAWFCRPEDAWCGNCGFACAQASLKLMPDVMQVNNITPTLHFFVSNQSCAELPLERMELPPWIKVTGMPASIAVGETVRFMGHARTMELKSPEAAMIVLRMGPAKAETVAMVIEEAPVLECIPSELELWGSGRRQVELTIAPKSGVLRVRSVSRGPLGDLELLSGPAEAVLASSQRGVSVVLQIDVERMRQQPKASLMVEFDSPHGPRQVEVRPVFQLRNPPEMRWEGENEPPVRRFKAIDQRLDFVVANKAADGRDGGTRNGRLSIESAVLEAPASLGEISIKLHQTSLPLMLRGGESATISFAVDLSKVPTGNESLHFRLNVTSNGPSLDKRAPVLVRALPVYDGVLAIDFGSSNTCVALVETGRELEGLPLDGKDEVSPTILRYMDLSGPVPEIETGARVKRLALTDDRFAASTADRLKQRLGDEDQNIPVRPYNSIEWVTRTATQAAADYLREVRRLVEARKQTIFRDFLLTHPAVCSLRQYRNLYLALTEAFGETARDVRFLQEPIAALIPFFAEQAESIESRSYTIASFDLGGGTTDIAIVRVENVPMGPARMEIRPAILFSRGFRFGGENLTDFLKLELEGRVTEILAVEKPGARLICKGTPGASTEDTLRNQFALRNFAEAFKAGQSEEGKKADMQSVALRVQSATDLSGEDYNIAFDRLCGGSTGDLKWVFLAELRRRVSDIAQLLLHAQGRVGKLDYIQLSGMTSYLPQVGECLREMFPEARVVRSGDPKECVVKGACLSRAMSRGSARYLVLPDGGRRTTSSIGLYDVTSANFTVILPVDTAIPSEGLQGELPEAWFGSERVALWENLGVSDDELRSDGTRSLSKLGTWEPAHISEAAEANGWTLRMTLKNFELDVKAVGPLDETIRFHRLDDLGTMGAA